VKDSCERKPAECCGRDPDAMGPARQNAAPLVSFIIPTHNYGRYVVEAVESALAQTYRNFEIIVVDDGSTDNTRQLLEPLRDRLQYIWRPQGGPSAARNSGIRASRGELIAFLDADDRWLPDKTRLQVSYLFEHPGIGLVSTRTSLMDEAGRSSSRREAPRDPVLELPAGKAFRDLFRQTNYIATSTVILRRECLETVGVFDESLSRVEDKNLWLRLGRCFGIARLPQRLALHRHHQSNLALDRDPMRRAAFANLDRICALYPDAARARNRESVRLFLKFGLQDIYEGRLQGARSNLAAAIRLRPFVPAVYPLLAASYAPPWLVEVARAASRTSRAGLRSVAALVRAPRRGRGRLRPPGREAGA